MLGAGILGTCLALFLSRRGVAVDLYDLAAAFHAFWNMGNDDPGKRIILTQNPPLSGARLFLAGQIGQVLRTGLAILGVKAVEEL